MPHLYCLDIHALSSAPLFGVCNAAIQWSPVDEIRKFLIVFKRRLCDAMRRNPNHLECYRKVLEMMKDLEAKLEEYKYEEVLKK